MLDAAAFRFYNLSRKEEISMDEQRKKLWDQIEEYLFTMSNDELLDVLGLIEDYISSTKQENST